MVDVSGRRFRFSEDMNARSEAVVQAMLEEYMLRTRDILIKNRGFLEAATEALIEKETLLFSDIREIREKFEIVKVAL